MAIPLIPHKNMIAIGNINSHQTKLGKDSRKKGYKPIQSPPITLISNAIIKKPNQPTINKKKYGKIFKPYFLNLELMFKFYLSFIVKFGTIEKSTNSSPQSVQLITSLLYSEIQLLHPHPSLRILSGGGSGLEERRLSPKDRKYLINIYIPTGIKSIKIISILLVNHFSTITKISKNDAKVA